MINKIKTLNKLIQLKIYWINFTNETQEWSEDEIDVVSILTEKLGEPEIGDLNFYYAEYNEETDEEEYCRFWPNFDLWYNIESRILSLETKDNRYKICELEFTNWKITQ